MINRSRRMRHKAIFLFGLFCLLCIGSLIAAQYFSSSESYYEENGLRFVWESEHAG